MRIFIITIGLLVSGGAWAQHVPAELNFDGVLSSGGTPVTSANVSFKFEVMDGGSNCVLYSEQHMGVDLSATNGAFSLKVGTGTTKQNFLASSSVFTRQIFENKGATGAFSGCAGVTLAAGSARKLRVSYDTAGGTSFTALTPDYAMTSIPFALVADSLQGKAPADFVPAPLSAGSNGQVLTVTGSGLVWSTISPSATQLQGAPVSSVAPSAGQVLTWNGTSSTWEPKTVSGAGTVTAVSAGTGLVGGTITSSGSISVNVGTGPNQIVQLNGSAQLPAVNGALLTSVNATSIGGWSVSTATPTNGYVLGWNGSQWTPMAVAGTGGGSDNLGNHTATQNIALGSFWLSNSGASNGLSVASSGAVGIGTSVPSTGAALDIKGSGTTLSSLIIPRDTTGNRPTGVNGMIRYNVTTQKFEGFEDGGWVNFGGGGGIDAVTIQGRAVSTAAPTANQVLGWNGSQWSPMTVAGTGGGADNLGNHTATTPIFAISGTAAAPGYTFSGASSSGMFSTGGGKLAFSASGTERMRIDTTGAVAIGTATPAASTRLHVFAPTGVTSLLKLDSSSTSATMDFSSLSGLARVGIGSSGGYKIDMNNDATEEFSIAPSGEVGIGISTPAEKLEVVGNIRTSGDILIGNSGAGCFAGREGAVRYNSGLFVLELCDGTVWKTVPAKQVMIYNGNSSNTAISTSSTFYAPLSGTYALSGAPYTSYYAAKTSNPVTRNGVLRNLHVKLSQSIAGTWTFTVVKNGVATGLTCTIGTDTCGDPSNTVSVVAGDDIGIKIDTGTSGAAAMLSWAVELESP